MLRVVGSEIVVGQISDGTTSHQIFGVVSLQLKHRAVASCVCLMPLIISQLILVDLYGLGQVLSLMRCRLQFILRGALCRDMLHFRSLSYVSYARLEGLYLPVLTRVRQSGNRYGQYYGQLGFC